MKKRLAKIEKISVIDEVIRTLKEMICSGYFEVGDKLPAELRLSEELGVGRSTVREALRVLQASGQVELKVGRGAFVKCVTDTNYEMIKKWFVEKESELGQLMEVRMAIEPVALKLAIQRGSKKQLAQIRQIHEAFKKAIDNGSALDLATLDESFHDSIIAASNNALLVKIGQLMSDTLLEYRTRAFAVTENAIHAVAPHENIVNSIMNHDEKAAAIAIQQHLEISLSDMKEVVRK